jgi:hypothetical protein
MINKEPRRRRNFIFRSTLFLIYSRPAGQLTILAATPGQTCAYQANAMAYPLLVMSFTAVVTLKDVI